MQIVDMFAWREELGDVGNQSVVSTTVPIFIAVHINGFANQQTSIRHKVRLDFGDKFRWKICKHSKQSKHVMWKLGKTQIQKQWLK